MDYATNSWVALGWKPMNLPTSCRLFPNLEYAKFDVAKMQKILNNMAVQKIMDFVSLFCTTEYNLI